MADIRLQKFLSQAGVCSRRKGETLIREGRIRINGVVADELGVRVNPEKDMVEFEGRVISAPREKIYIALNKPEGYVSSCVSQGGRIVLDLLDIKERVFPVGRLDKDSSGLLLLTNDGALHHRLSHPSFDHEKEYQVVLKDAIGDDDLNQMASGMFLDGRKTRPARVKRISATQFSIVLKEGRNRQIRRMAEGLGNRVTGLKRVRVAGIKLGALKEAQWRYLEKKETRQLLSFKNKKEK